ncbi:hypothetical protein KAU51_04215 [Candidatus Parcubacteria bacterium]|nr:hypothetical protein [Candidatus Parcubacteria bacterium]
MRKIQYQIREEVGKVKSENEKIAIILVATIFVLLVMYIALSISNIKSGFELAELQIQKQELEFKNDELKSIIKKLPVIKVEIEIKTETETEIFEISAYNTVEWQTDDSPCISASGKNICGRDDVIACPIKYKYGTQMRILDKIYTCEDRMKKDGGIDISFDKDIAAAINWGRKVLAVQILK